MDKIRYSRQIAIEGFGEEAQKKLSAATVAVIGCGALGSMVAMQLAGAGVGCLVIADFDTVDISNLQRQFFFKNSDAGKKKVALMAESISALNPQVTVKTVDGIIGKSNSGEFLEGVGFVIDATDNPASKRIIEEICGEKGIPCCIAGVIGFHGQVMTIFPYSKKFSDVFLVDENAGFTPCSIGGVIGPAAALCASIQASEAIKCITGVGDILTDKLLTFDLLTNCFNLLKL